MLVKQHQRSPTAVTGSALRAWHLAAATAPSAVQPLPTAPSAVQPPPVATVDSSLAPILARAVQERALRRWERPATAVVQREVVHEQDWWDTVGNLIGVTGQRIGDAVDSITGKVGETAEKAIDYVVDSAVGTAKPSGSSTAVDTTVKPKAESKTGRRVEMTSFPRWDGGSVSRPTTDDWFGMSKAAGVLDRVRRGEALMSRHGMPKGGDQGALKLVKQAILALGCEVHHLNLLPKAGPTGPFGPETEAAVKEMQHVHGLSADGVVGARTMAVLDNFITG